jgi:hypothetical protein
VKEKFLPRYRYSLLNLLPKQAHFNGRNAIIDSGCTSGIGDRTGKSNGIRGLRQVTREQPADKANILASVLVLKFIGIPLFIKINNQSINCFMASIRE